jgi:hypothetical protein
MPSHAVRISKVSQHNEKSDEEEEGKKKPKQTTTANKTKEKKKRKEKIKVQTCPSSRNEWPGQNALVLFFSDPTPRLLGRVAPTGIRVGSLIGVIACGSKRSDVSKGHYGHDQWRGRETYSTGILKCACERERGTRIDMHNHGQICWRHKLTI